MSWILRILNPDKSSEKKLKLNLSSDDLYYTCWTFKTYKIKNGLIFSA